MKQDLSRKSEYRFDWLIRLALRLSAAMLPIAASFGLSNLVYVLIGGGFSTMTIYICPFILQVKSIHVCIKEFGNHCENSIEKSVVGKVVACLKDVLFGSRRLYTTPYSYPVLSHPVCAIALIAIGLCLVGLLIINFFIEPKKMYCNWNYTSLYVNETLAV